MGRAIIIVNQANDRITTNRFITKPPVASGSVLSAFLEENSTSPSKHSKSKAFGAVGKKSERVNNTTSREEEKE